MTNLHVITSPHNTVFAVLLSVCLAVQVCCGAEVYHILCSSRISHGSRRYACTHNYAHYTQIYIPTCCTGPVEVMFIGGTPLVTDNDITVRLMVEPPVPLLCQVVTRSQPGMPVISHEQDCKSEELLSM